MISDFIMKIKICKGDDLMYLPLGYVKRFDKLTDLYCSKERCDCEPEVLLDMISDENWGKDNYKGPNREKYGYIYNEFSGNFFEMHEVSACFAAAGFCGIWKYNKIVYEPDYDFSNELIGTKKLRVYPDLIKHLPFNTFYLDFSKNSLFEYEGFFVQIKKYETGAIRIAYLPTEKNFSYIPVEEYKNTPTAYMDVFWITPDKLRTEYNISYFDFDLLKDYIYTSDSYKTQWFIGGVSKYRLFLLQFLMYLSSDKPDIEEDPDTKKTYRPSGTIKNQYKEIRKWNVGCRYGETLRRYNTRKAHQWGINEKNIQNSKRPHVRKAHWERYHIGKGRKEITIKWKSSIIVNGGTDDIIANIHAVTNEDPKCSRGEDLIKQYLKSKNIEFKQQHYIGEIRKRYDFKIERNGIIAFVEFDGEQHFKLVNKWGGKKDYQKRKKADLEKNKYCVKNRIPLLRIRYDQAHMISDMIDDLIVNSEKYCQQFNTYLTNCEYYSICE